MSPATRSIAVVVCLASAPLLLLGCAHAPAPAPKVVAPTKAVTPWTGVVRLASGNSSRDFHDEKQLVVETVQGMVAGLGVESRVDCLDHRGDLGARGAVHARVRVEFLDPLTTEKEREVRRTLHSLQPNVDAYLLFPDEARLTRLARDLAGKK
jgi:hypothetical protein